MHFEAVKDILFSDTLVPDIFISDIMPNLPADAVKVYLYCLFLSKYGKEARPEDLAAKLGMSVDAVYATFTILEKEELILRTPQVITLIDLKDREVSRLYRKKTSSDADEAVSRTAMNIRRNQCVDSINKMFFQGIMAPSWYTTIDHWFETFRFDEDVMVSLFKYCYDRNALNARYIEKVGATWAARGITNHWELEKYMELCEKVNELGKQIAMKLRLNRKLTSYEERYLETWINEYGYGMDIIDLALEKTTGKTNPNFKYIHGVLTGWHKDGLRTREQILAASQAAASRDRKRPADTVARRDNFMQRSYDDTFFDMLDKASVKGKDRDNGPD
ncbi:MAG TPA: DnaD domain protein [Thermoclostridium caenicola]|uniref:DnaD and phage-associated domain-containing protein n=1 Tax=Thermoclostridium caenicola TaxID=659425 RepID=A0A1M6I9W4_9FIRM|nr:DnaD domain protein [Thermoclostridium caenicola]SHJ31212.1 DnaD and phage-associated domain-containing protein [Thermoclostridium caenicola]HOK42402.1 DnaD domain protein [Thermoclostridium caenicola]HOL84464.1 DnaD domain protein [Thermoclostridium caenicola]HOP72358.1 DnaD domain protein [Thermoclostridium caenicola]HPO75880.1 DnaD domain protein [Thermoclostridium caenicola]